MQVQLCCVHTDRQQDKSSRGHHRFSPELHTGEHVQPEEQCDRSWIFDHSEVAFRAGSYSASETRAQSNQRRPCLYAEVCKLQIILILIVYSGFLVKDFKNTQNLFVKNWNMLASENSLQISKTFTKLGLFYGVFSSEQ